MFPPSSIKKIGERGDDGRHGGICTGESYKDHLKLTFFKGASLKDPMHLFNQDGTVRRAIDIYEGGRIDESAFKNLVRAAVKLNSEVERSIKKR